MLNFDECRVNVFAQLYENGKPKGGITHTFAVDSDLMMYFAEDVLDCVKNVLEDLSNEHCRLEYLSHEVEFFEPTDITEKVKDAWERSLWQQKTRLQELHDEGDV